MPENPNPIPNPIPNPNPNPIPNAPEHERFRAALRRWEEAPERAAPGFEGVLRRVRQEPSPVAKQRWPAARSLRVAWALVRAQVRVVPWLVWPVALLAATMAGLAARFLGTNLGGSAEDSGFTSVMLVGVVASVTMALSASRADAIALSTPLGPQAVVLARISLVLLVDAAAGVAASVLATAAGYSAGLPELVVAWLSPFALIAAAATFATIWVAPWVGAVAAGMLIPLVAPAPDAVVFFALSGALREALTPLGLAVAGAALLLGAVASARRAAVSGSLEA